MPRTDASGRRGVARTRIGQYHAVYGGPVPQSVPLILIATISTLTAIISTLTAIISTLIAIISTLTAIISSVRYVEQEPTLFDRSVLENIAYGRANDESYPSTRPYSRR